MRRAEMLLLKSLAETLMADRDNRHDDLQATMRLAHLSSPEMILYMVNRGGNRPAAIVAAGLAGEARYLQA